MPYYHATRRDRIDSILRYGLGITGEKNFPGCETGVYLSSEPGLGVIFLLEHYLEHGTPDSSPRAMVESYVVIVIDDSRVDASKVRPDPEFDDMPWFLIYDGVIDVTGMPIIAAVDMFGDIQVSVSPD